MKLEDIRTAMKGAHPNLCPFCRGTKANPRLEELHDGSGKGHGGWRIICYGCMVVMSCRTHAMRSSSKPPFLHKYWDGDYWYEDPNMLYERWNKWEWWATQQEAATQLDVALDQTLEAEFERLEEAIDEFKKAAKKSVSPLIDGINKAFGRGKNEG